LKAITSPFIHSIQADKMIVQLLLLALLLTSALPWPAIIWNIFLGEVVVVSALCGALVSSSYKWGYFVIAVLALLGIIWNVLAGARRYAKVLSANIFKTFSVGSFWLMGLWFIYPIAWGVSEGGNVIGLDGEMVFYGILDVLTIPVFGAIMLWGHRSIDPAALGLVMRDYNAPYVHEKEIHAPQASRGVTEGDATTAV
jgi:bacteriorhodopsin